MRKRIYIIGFLFFGFCMFLSQSVNVDTERKDSSLDRINPVATIKDETQKFLHLISLKESNGRSSVVSKRGYMGLYQFHPTTLKKLGMDVSRKKFLKSKKLQDSAMMAYLNLNKKILFNEIQKYTGKKIKGKTITESGILAGAHLAGADKVKRYLRYGVDKTDGNGMRISYYIRKFSGYNINLDNN